MRIEEVNAIRMKRARVNHETYKSFYTQCCNRIRRRASLLDGPRWMWFTVPMFAWDRPPFKHHHAVRYVAEKLSRDGYQVTEVAPGRLCVSWKSAFAMPVPPPPKPKERRKPDKHSKPSKASTLSARLEALRKRLG